MTPNIKAIPLILLGVLLNAAAQMQYSMRSKWVSAMLKRVCNTARNLATSCGRSTVGTSR